MQKFRPHFLQDKSTVVLIKELSTIMRENRKSIKEYVSRYDKALRSIPNQSRPTVEVHKEWFLEGLDPDMRFIVEYKLPANFVQAKQIVVATEERLIRKGKGRPNSFAPPKEEKEVILLPT